MDVNSIINQMPSPYNGENEICHVFTLNFALCAVGRASECHAGVMKNPFDLKEKLLAKQECQDGTKMNAGNIVTFWQGPSQQEILQHSMVIEDRNNWIGSNNLNSFKIWGARRSIFMLSSGIILDEDNSKLTVDGKEYRLRFYDVNTFASCALLRH